MRKVAIGERSLGADEGRMGEREGRRQKTEFAPHVDLPLLLPNPIDDRSRGVASS